ncbi:hypothetical protein NECAME_04600 [Necator americanus]|uniref:Uncharacterized protein n=1 Tax=Necator americanus TaxID=51031 RepID=W2SSP6_NECAM|nr:hypothetical protein NECAME_04600 [Necator americanus]ETN71856.1 hypothetical protein NECAME_04600 [Necator americanus]
MLVDCTTRLLAPRVGVDCVLPQATGDGGERVCARCVTPAAPSEDTETANEPPLADALRLKLSTYISKFSDQVMNVSDIDSYRYKSAWTALQISACTVSIYTFQIS